MIKIKAVERKIGFNKTGKTLWYPAIHLHSDVKFEEFIELVADETTVSSADVKAVFDRSAKVLIRLLQDGKSVDCGDMGTFRPSITAKTGMGVYTPRVKVKTALKGVRLERAERVLDVACKRAEKKKKDTKPGGGSTPSPDNGGHVGP